MIRKPYHTSCRPTESAQRVQQPEPVRPCQGMIGARTGVTRRSFLRQPKSSIDAQSSLSPISHVINNMNGLSTALLRVLDDRKTWVLYHPRVAFPENTCLRYIIRRRYGTPRAPDASASGDVITPWVDPWCFRIIWIIWPTHGPGCGLHGRTLARGHRVSMRDTIVRPQHGHNTVNLRGCLSDHTLTTISWLVTAGASSLSRVEGSRVWGARATGGK